jgi:hypothetical protein
LTVERDPLSSAVELGLALERHEVPYAIGGALAYGMWGHPRFTADVDINVFVEPSELAPVFRAFDDVGAVYDPAEATRRAEVEGMFIARLEPFRVDVFTPSIPYSRRAGETRVRLSARGQAVWFLSANASAVFKLLFFRGKDLRDLKVLIRVQGPKLDRQHVADAVAEVVGSDDQRLEAWWRLCREVDDAEARA